MSLFLKLVGTLALLMGAACTSGVTTTEEPAQESKAVQKAPKAPARQPTTLDREERVANLRPLLRARHAADLPNKATLDRHQDPGDSLRWLTNHDNSRVIRVRALVLLKHYPSKETRELVLEVARSAAEPSGVRAAALRAMGGFDLAQEVPMREELAARMGSRDPMLAVAAVQTLALQSSTAELGRMAASDPGLPQVTRDAAVAATE